MQITTTLADAIRPRLHLLAGDMTTAGLITRGLNLDGTTLTTSDTSGSLIELSGPAQAFVSSYVPPTSPPSPNYGSDLLSDDALMAQAATIVAGLIQYRGLASPTLAQSTQALKALCQVAIFQIHDRFPGL